MAASGGTVVVNILLGAQHSWACVIWPREIPRMFQLKHGSLLRSPGGGGQVQGFH